MNGMRRSSQSGFILLQVIGALLIVFTVAGLCMSLQPLEVLSLKQARVQKDLAMLAEGWRLYAEDLISANYYDVSTGSTHYRCQYSLPIPQGLSALVRPPNVGSTEAFMGGSGNGNLPDSNFWKGPYVALDSNASPNLAMTWDESGQPIDPWGVPYVYTVDVDSNPGTWDNKFKISSRSPEAGSANALIVDMYPYYKALTEKRIAAFNVALTAYLNQIKTISGARNVYNALPTALATGTTTPTCAESGAILSVVPGPQSGYFCSDAWGMQLLCYSNPNNATLSGWNPTSDNDPAYNKVKYSTNTTKIIPTDAYSGILGISLPAGAVE